MTRAMCVLGVALFAGSSLACEQERQPPTRPSAPPAVVSVPPAPPPPAPPQDHPLTGLYSLRIDIGSGCAGTLGAARIRTYEAAISSTDGTNYLVTLGGAAFLSGPICTGGSQPECNQFLATRDRDAMAFNLANDNGEGHGGHIVEQLTDGTWVELIGQASGTMRDGTLEASGNGSVWYCGSRRTYPYPCFAATCRTDDMTLTFTRR